jgi:hypothetical protein
MIIIITGLTLAFGDTSGGARKLIQIVFGLSGEAGQFAPMIRAVGHQTSAPPPNEKNDRKKLDAANAIDS